MRLNGPSDQIIFLFCFSGYLFLIQYIHNIIVMKKNDLFDQIFLVISFITDLIVYFKVTFLLILLH